MTAVMDIEERCQLTELIVTQCAHCRPPRRPAFLAALFDSPDDDTIVASFPARYAGRCADCDGYFGVGAWISRTSDDNYVCSECAP